MSTEPTQYQQHYKRAVLTERQRCIEALSHCSSLAEAKRVITEGEQPPRSAGPASSRASPRPTTPTARDGSGWDRVVEKYSRAPLRPGADPN